MTWTRHARLLDDGMMLQRGHDRREYILKLSTKFKFAKTVDFLLLYQIHEYQQDIEFEFFEYNTTQL